MSTKLAQDRITPASKQWGITQVNVRNFSYTWTINNFSYCKESTGQWLLSPPFSAGFNDKIKWCLKMYPKGIDERLDDATNIGLYLELLEAGDKLAVHAKFKFSILNAKRENVLPVSSKLCLFNKDHTFWGFLNVVNKKELLNEELGLLPEDKLTIFCEVSVVGDSTNVTGHSVEVPECRLTEDLGVLLDDERLYDVTLVADGRVLRAHRAVLAARSAVFAAMFEHPLEESARGRVDIADVGPDVLGELLHFMYTGRAPRLSELAGALLVAADKYALERLKAMCEEVLVGRLTVETAAATLLLADQHSAAQLKAQTIDYIVAGRLARVMDMDSWKNIVLLHSKLSFEVFRALATQQQYFLHGKKDMSSCTKVE